MEEHRTGQSALVAGVVAQLQAGAYTRPLYSAQLEPFLTQKHTLNTPNTPYHPLNSPETTPYCTHCHTEGAEVEPKGGRVSAPGCRPRWRSRLPG